LLSLIAKATRLEYGRVARETVQVTGILRASVPYILMEGA
jgi:hypothetical protein